MPKFARMYSEKLKIDKDLLQKKLWGDNYYDPSTKKWITSDTGSDGTKLERGFVQFIMNPIIKLTKNIFNNNKEAVFKIIGNLNIQLS